MVLRLTVATVILMVSILLQVREGEGFFSTPMRGLYLFAGLAYLLAIVYAVLERQVRDQVRFAIVQIAGDLVLLSGIVLITGGAASPFIILYFLIIIGAGILFYRAGSMIAAAASAVLYGVAVAAPLVPRVAAFIDPDGTTLAMGRAAVGYRHLLAVFSFFLVAFLASYLAESLRRVGEELSQRERVARRSRAPQRAHPAEHRQRSGDHRPGRAHHLLQSRRGAHRPGAGLGRGRASLSTRSSGCPPGLTRGGTRRRSRARRCASRA